MRMIVLSSKSQHMSIFYYYEVVNYLGDIFCGSLRISWIFCIWQQLSPAAEHEGKCIAICANGVLIFKTATGCLFGGSVDYYKKKW